MRYSRLVRVCIAVMLLVLAGGCAQEQAQPPQPVEFTPTEGMYAAYTGEVFGMNLLFTHLRTENLEQSNITGVELQPQTSLVKVNGFRVLSRGIGNTQARKVLTLELTAPTAGEHTFTDITITTRNGSYAAPLGELRVTIKAGPLSRVQALFQSKGEIVSKAPGSFVVANPSDETLMLKQIIPAHPRLGLGDAGIVISGNGAEQPFPAGGLELPPRARVTLNLNWKLDFPGDRPINVEWRPMLVIERQGSEEYVGMANLIFRNEPANGPLS